MKLAKILAATALCCGMALAQSTSSSHFLDNPDVSVKAVATTGLPATIANPKVQTDFGRQLSQVTFTVKVDDATIRTILVAAVIRSADGQPIGAEVWPLGRSCKESTSAPLAGNYSQTLKHDLNATTQLSLIVSEVITDKVVYRSPWFQQMQLDAPLIASVTKLNAHSPDFVCTPDFCDWCALEATAMCASKGVRQFSCSVGTCSCMFTCNP